MKNKIILDTDMVGDDILALIVANNHPNLDLLGVTTVNGASGSVEHASQIALAILDYLGSEVKVFKGNDSPLEEVKKDGEQLGDPVNFFEELRDSLGSRLDLMNANIDEQIRVYEEQYAVDYLISESKRNKGELSIVATGPLTNLAEAILKDSEFSKNVKRLYILGGTFKVPGNITPVVEYNIFADPEAAQIVFNSNIDIVLVPLDVCETNTYADSMLTRDELSDLIHRFEDDEKSSKICKFIADKFSIYIDVWRKYFAFKGFPIDDVIPVMLAADESYCEYSDYLHIDVATQGILTRGQTIAYEGKQIYKLKNSHIRNVRISKDIRGSRIIEDMIGAITKTFK